MNGRWFVACLTLALCAPASQVTAQSGAERWLVEGEVGAVAPLSSPQRDRFRPGLSGGVGLLRSVAPKVLLGLHYRGGVLFDGPPPDDPTLADPGVGSLSTLSLGVRVRPLGQRDDPSRLGGLFVEVAGGAALTGSSVRLQGGGGVGWGFAVGVVSLAPVLRYTWIHQPSGQLDSRDAHLISLGLQVGLLDGRAPEPEPEESEPQPEVRDRDRDGIADPDDSCPDDPEDFDAFEDADGCPDEDNDQDGIADTDDQCPMRPEDMDQFEDDDGCPDADNDLDGFPDVRDACPNDAEVVNGVDDEDGCPDEGLIEMVQDRIVLEETVLFDFQRSRVKSRARPVIEAIVQLASQHPEWTRMRIEGHADVRGNEEFNMELSVRRARNTMRALVEAGIPEDRLEFVGYGETQPRDLRRTEAAHQRNRRVEFVVLQRRELTDEEVEERDRQGAEQRGAIEEARGR